MSLPATTGLRLRLRHETRLAHDALDRSLDLVGRPLNRLQYGRLLGRLHGLHRMIEPALSAVLEPSLIAGRSKLAALRHDLQACGIGGLSDEAGISVIPGLPRLADRASALGTLYVVEGSTLGGLVIADHLRGGSHIPADAFRYFEIYGRRSAEMWRTVCTTLDAVEDVIEVDRVMNAALATFDMFQIWLDPALWRDEGVRNAEDGWWARQDLNL